MNSEHPKLFGGFLVIAIFISCGHIAYEPFSYQPPFMSVDKEWADTTLSQLTLEEKIGQLFVLTTTLPLSANHTQQLVNNYQPAGILLKEVSVQTYQKTIQQVRKAAKIPLLELSDEVTALNNQYTNIPNYPNYATLSALATDFSYRFLDKKLVADYQRVGINCSLSPSIQSFEAAPSDYAIQQQPQNDVALISRATDRVEALKKQKILSIANAFDFYVDSIADATLIEEGTFNQYKPLVISGSVSYTHLTLPTKRIV